MSATSSIGLEVRILASRSWELAVWFMDCWADPCNSQSKVCQGWQCQKLLLEIKCNEIQYMPAVRTLGMNAIVLALKEYFINLWIIWPSMCRLHGHTNIFNCNYSKSCAPCYYKWYTKRAFVAIQHLKY